MVDKTIKCINLGPTEEELAGCFLLYKTATESNLYSRHIHWVDYNRPNPMQEKTCFEGKISKDGTGEEVEMQESKEDSLDDTKVHDLRETRGRARATSTAGRNEGDDTAQTILDTVKDDPEKAARAQIDTDSKAGRTEGDTLKDAPEKSARAQRHLLQSREN